jgi:preprotein translocase SecE subunit
MATNIVASGAEEPDDEKDDAATDALEKSSQDKLTSPSGKKKSGTGFFTVYKYGQGKWTRLGTLAVAGFLAVLTTYNLYQYLISYWPGQGNPAHDRTLHQYMLGASILFLLALCVLIFRLSNRIGNVDFLIATDSEMKKVNWTTKGELLGSTRVVVLFLFFIAIFLFVVDLLFSAFFQLIGVLLKPS